MDYKKLVKILKGRYIENIDIENNIEPKDRNNGDFAFTLFYSCKNIGMDIKSQ